MEISFIIYGDTPIHTRHPNITESYYCICKRIQHTEGIRGNLENKNWY